jgi:hypothetical protein
MSQLVGGKRMPVEELRQEPMMAHLLDALDRGQDIGHYGRLVFVMVGRHFMQDEEIIDRQKFPICPATDDPGQCNVYRNLEFPKEIYDRIAQYYEGQTN